MKKMAFLIGLASTFALVLTACGSPPASSPGSIDSTSAPPISTEVDLSLPVPAYSEELNAYNSFTAANDEFYFVLDSGSIHRINKDDLSLETIVSPEEGGVSVDTSGRIATYENQIYFVGGGTGQRALYRADVDGSNPTKVGGLGDDYRIRMFEGNIIAAKGNYNEYGMKQSMAYRIFKTDAMVDSLEEISPDTLDDEQRQTIDYLLDYVDEYDLLWERLFPEASEIMFDNYIRTENEYFMRGLGGGFYKGTLDPDEVEFMTLPDEVMEGTGTNPSAKLVNYDAEWLYVRDEFRLYRVKRDGSEYQLLAENGVEKERPIDVIGGQVFYRGTNGALYMNNDVIAAPSPDSIFGQRMTMEATIVDTEWGIYARPDSDSDRAIMGERININTHTPEMIDEEGNTISFGSLTVGTRVQLIYKGYLEVEDYVIFEELYRITLLNN